ncbi:bacterial Ig-like domain-containing protein [Treponema sp.]|uniref:bacterial Ig-like domain-containing protein n=1 Tax=Treponema sp. TaxID=166 RepID=UPI0025E33FD4|nr:bacterial Ig-like domain-containing protein [Treponema sp.]MCR5218405.1 bacterial Ig-like domain-containing protein [Treponema sp.]
MRRVLNVLFIFLTISVLSSCSNIMGDIIIDPDSENESKSLSSITVTTPPSKLYYNLSEDFITDGMVVTATYEDASTSTVTEFTTDFDSSSPGAKELTVSYSSGGVTKTATTPYYVVASDSLTESDGL